MPELKYNESWYFLGGRKFASKETGEYLGVEVWLQNSSSQPPIKATCLCDSRVADWLLGGAQYRPIDNSLCSVRWSSRKKKWYLFVDTEKLY